MFCAEHTAECYQKAGMLTEKTLNSNEVLPSMFDVGAVVDRLMAQCGHGSLQAPVLLKAPGSVVTRRVHEKRKASGPASDPRRYCACSPQVMLIIDVAT